MVVLIVYSNILFSCWHYAAVAYFKQSLGVKWRNMIIQYTHRTLKPASDTLLDT